MESALCCLKVGQSGTIVSVNADNDILRRLLDIGIVVGTKVMCVLKSPWGDPTAYLIRGAVIALRNEDSSKIIVKVDSYFRGANKNGSDHTIRRRNGHRYRYKK